MRSRNVSRLRAAACLAGLILLALYPLAVSNPYYARIGGLVLLSAISASAWNIVGGYAGQVSVGHSMFYGVGAYLPLMLYSNWQLAPALGVPIGILLAVLLAVLVGFPTFRLQGHYFSMATIAVAELIRLVFSNWELFGAAIGVRGPAVSRTVWDFAFRSVIPYYYLFLAGLGAVLGTTWLIERSRMGYYLRAIKSGERAARSLGVPSRRYKLYALMTSAAFASLAGSFYALWIGFVDPESGLGILVSVEMIIVTALGGAGTLFGPLIGALILIPLQNF
ncbi:MAG: branched-chain amino acid ABC transporter permease, partial [SAR324 cluster bacterium]